MFYAVFKFAVFLTLCNFLKEGSVSSIRVGSRGPPIPWKGAGAEPLPGVQGAELPEDFGFKLFRALKLLYLKVILVIFGKAENNVQCKVFKFVVFLTLCNFLKEGFIPSIHYRDEG